MCVRKRNTYCVPGTHLPTQKGNLDCAEGLAPFRPRLLAAKSTFLGCSYYLVSKQKSIINYYPRLPITYACRSHPPSLCTLNKFALLTLAALSKTNCSRRHCVSDCYLDCLSRQFFGRLAKYAPAAVDMYGPCPPTPAGHAITQP